MLRIAHGSTTADSVEPTDDLLEDLSALADEFEFRKLDTTPQPTPFTYLFDDLSDDEDSLIFRSSDTLENLSRLGDMMMDAGHQGYYNSAIPSIYTYFGQFVDHDITFTNVDKSDGVTDSELLDSKSLAPWTKHEIFTKIRNKRTSLLDLDCVYGATEQKLLPPLRKDNPDMLGVGKVAKSGYAVPYKDERNDVPRRRLHTDPKKDRAALIADPRNDSHVIISQMHVAFLRAHNAIVDREKCSFDEARRILQMHYQWILIKEFLPTIVSQDAIDNAMKGPVYDPAKGLPLEFAVGAYRFGHSMVRSTYYLNANYPRQPLPKLFTLTVLSDVGHPTPHKGFATLPEKAVIQWKKFLAGGKNAARVMRPKMVEPLFQMLDEANIKVRGECRLSVLDLKRSYMMRIPTGQAIANRLGITPLSATEIESTFPDANDREFLRKTTLSERTPLFLYVLAEAALNKEGKLGPVGGRLVAKVLIGIIQSYKYSFLNKAWSPHVGKTKGRFFLTDLLQLAGVLDA